VTSYEAQEIAEVVALQRDILRTIHHRREASELHVAAALAMLLVQAWADIGGTDEGLHDLVNEAADLVRELPARVAEC
jgi:hypothetical protein